MSKWFKTQHYNFDPGDGTETITGTLWKNDSASLFLYLMGSYYYISSTLGSQYMIDGNNLSTYFYKCGGYRYFNGSAGYLWYDSANKWCISVAPNFGIGSSNAWWKCNTLVGTYTAQGTAAGTKTVTKTLNGWRSSELNGVYAAVGTEGGTKFVGVRKILTDMIRYGGLSRRNDAILFTETFDTYNGKRFFTGVWTSDNADAEAELWFDGSYWIISSACGVKDLVVGYYRTTSNNKLASYWFQSNEVRFGFQGFSVTDIGYSDNKDVYLTEVGTWL